MTACATVAPPKIADSACLSFSTLTYANARDGEGHADDAGNRLDTPETVTEIAAHNAAWRAICGEQ